MVAAARWPPRRPPSWRVPARGHATWPPPGARTPRTSACWPPRARLGRRPPPPDPPSSPPPVVVERTRSRCSRRTQSLMTGDLVLAGEPCVPVGRVHRVVCSTAAVDHIHPRAGRLRQRRHWHPVRVEVPALRRIHIRPRRQDAVLLVVEAPVDREVQAHPLALACQPRRNGEAGRSRWCAGRRRACLVVVLVAALELAEEPHGGG